MSFVVAKALPASALVRLVPAVTDGMAGFAIDENPIPSNTLGFELPDSDALLYSVGVRYKLNKDMELGVAFLYDYKESRSVNNLAAGGTVNGTFENASAQLLTFGFSYKL